VAGELTFLYRQTMGHRYAQPARQAGVVELDRATGWDLSTPITEREIPQWLEETDLSQYFDGVLSSLFGHRKPGPEISYWEAARQAGVTPAQAAYVADNRRATFRARGGPAWG